MMGRARKTECAGKDILNYDETEVSYHVDCGSTYYDRTSTWNEDTEEYDRTWTCNNCCAITPRITRKARTDVMTKTQQQIIDNVKSRGNERGVWRSFEAKLDEYGWLIIKGDLCSDLDSHECWDTRVSICATRRGKFIYASCLAAFSCREMKSTRDLWMVYP